MPLSGFNYLMLGLAGVAGALFVILLRMLVRRTQGRGGFEPPDSIPENPLSTAPTSTADLIVVPPPPHPVPEAPPYSAWRLVSRMIANPDSAGGPLYRLRFAPEGVLPIWQAGAIARVYCGPAEDVLTPGVEAKVPAGDYMIGSLPEDGTVDLVVRLRSTQQVDDERVRSQWLCQDIHPGQLIALALRDDPGFAPPAEGTPLILIGNATGIAGLEAHIKARPAGTRNWLIFGDRRSADDQMLASAVTEWVSSGHLERCDLVLPGDGPEQRRITDQLADVSETLLDWGLAGAAIFVCGSVPMGNDVHRALAQLLGPEVLEAMADEGLYRRSLF